MSLLNGQETRKSKTPINDRMKRYRESVISKPNKKMKLEPEDKVPVSPIVSDQFLKCSLTASQERKKFDAKMRNTNSDKSSYSPLPPTVPNSSIKHKANGQMDINCVIGAVARQQYQRHDNINLPSLQYTNVYSSKFEEKQPQQVDNLSTRKPKLKARRRHVPSTSSENKMIGNSHSNANNQHLFACGASGDQKRTVKNTSSWPSLSNSVSPNTKNKEQLRDRSSGQQSKILRSEPAIKFSDNSRQGASDVYKFNSPITSSNGQQGSNNVPIGVSNRQETAASSRAQKINKRKSKQGKLTTIDKQQLLLNGLSTNYKIPKKPPISLEIVDLTKSVDTSADVEVMEVENPSSIAFPLTETQDLGCASKKKEKIIAEVNEFRHEVSEIKNSSCLSVNNKTDSTWDELSESGDWFLVVDTNVFIHSLTFLQEIVAKNVPGLGYPVIYVPLRVIRELDALKQNLYLKNAEARYGARSAINFINKCLSVHHPRVKGQSWNHYKLLDTDGKSVDSTSDDKILLSCIQLIKAQPKKVILISNDINLRNKALIERVESFSVDEMKDHLSNLAMDDMNKKSAAERRPLPATATVSAELSVVEPVPTEADKSLQQILHTCWTVVSSELLKLQAILQSGTRSAAVGQHLAVAVTAMVQLVSAVKSVRLMIDNGISNETSFALFSSSVSNLTGINTETCVSTLSQVSPAGKALMAKAEDVFVALLEDFKLAKQLFYSS